MRKITTIDIKDAISELNFIVDRITILTSEAKQYECFKPHHNKINSLINDLKAKYDELDNNFPICEIIRYKYSIWDIN